MGEYDYKYSGANYSEAKYNAGLIDFIRMNEQLWVPLEQIKIQVYQHKYNKLIDYFSILNSILLDYIGFFTDGQFTSIQDLREKNSKYKMIEDKFNKFLELYNAAEKNNNPQLYAECLMILRECEIFLADFKQNIVNMGMPKKTNFNMTEKAYKDFESNFNIMKLIVERFDFDNPKNKVDMEKMSEEYDKMLKGKPLSAESDEDIKKEEEEDKELSSNDVDSETDEFNPVEV
jgi:hypothetical protein